jgi:hypothetical protein
MRRSGNVGDDNEEEEDKEYKLLRLKLITVLNDHVATRNFNRHHCTGLGSIPPLSLWPLAIHRACMKSPTYKKDGRRVNHRLFRCKKARAELENENNEWQATTSFSLMKEGLVGKDQWIELIYKKENGGGDSSNSRSPYQKHTRSQNGCRRTKPQKLDDSMEEVY